jgi:large subunit ribosomal protein L29
VKPSELHDLTEDKLREHVATTRRDLFGLRMQHATGELENTARMRAIKRDLARALTVARLRGIELNEHTTS